MFQSECPFCNPDPARVFLQGELIVGLWTHFRWLLATRFW
jgi:hypothetical protein